MAYEQRRSQESRSAAARALLVRAAIEVLADGGYTRATTAAIATKARVTTGALHHHFPSKDDLFFAVLDELTQQALALFRGLGGSATAGESMARSIVMELWSLYGSKQYWSVWEINMGYRAEETMRRRLIDHRVRTREKMYQALLANERLDARAKEVLISSLPFVLSALRGIFLDTFFTDAERASKLPQLDTLVAVLDERFAAAASGAATGAPAGATLD
jgi:AcrR family transcriptional regulator